MKTAVTSTKLKFIALATGIFIFFTTMQLTTWLPLQFWQVWGGGAFIDSQQVLSWAGCYEKQGTSVYAMNGDCSGYLYGSTLLEILSSLNLHSPANYFFGYAFFIILASAISYVSSISRYRYSSQLVLAVVISPPLLLLAERANFDIVVLSLVVFAGVLFCNKNQIWALVPLGLATLIKFYTLPLFIIFFLLNRGKIQKTLTLATLSITSVFVIKDLSLIQTSFPSGSHAKFGASIWARYLPWLSKNDQIEIISNVSGIAILFLSGCAVSLLLKRWSISVVTSRNGTMKERVLFYLLFSTHLSCYLLGMSFDYRLVFYALSSIIYVSSLSTENGKLSSIFLMMFTLAMWLTYASTGLEPLGDLFIEITTLILGIRFAQLLMIDLKQKNA
jgi:hypothetical protein